MFKVFRDTANIHRQEYVDKKSSYSPIGLSCIGYLRPLSPEKQEVGIDKYGKEFAFNTTTEIEIRESDKLEIAGTFYRVKGVASHAGVIIKYKRVLLIKE